MKNIVPFFALVAFIIACDPSPLSNVEYPAVYHQNQTRITHAKAYLLEQDGLVEIDFTDQIDNTIDYFESGTYLNTAPINEIGTTNITLENEDSGFMEIFDQNGTLFPAGLRTFNYSYQEEEMTIDFQGLDGRMPEVSRPYPINETGTEIYYPFFAAEYYSEQIPGQFGPRYTLPVGFSSSRTDLQIAQFFDASPDYYVGVGDTIVVIKGEFVHELQ